MQADDESVSGCKLSPLVSEDVSLGVCSPQSSSVDVDQNLVQPSAVSQAVRSVVAEMAALTRNNWQQKPVSEQSGEPVSEGICQADKEPPKQMVHLTLGAPAPSLPPSRLVTNVGWKGECHQQQKSTERQLVT